MTSDVRSPTTGLVIEVKVGPGDIVHADNELLVIESMKMHIPVTAPAAGRIESLMVKDGDQVAEPVV